MKIIKGLAVLFVTLSLGSCFDPPEFPIVPQIDYEDVVFKQGNGTDSLILTLSFKDGDGDLGVDAAAPEFNNAPYNNLTFFQTDASDKTKLIPVNTVQQTVEHINKQGQRVTANLHLLQFENLSAGQLVFPRTRKQPGYSYLPAYSCESYEWFRSAGYAIREDQKAVLDKTAMVDTLFTRLNGVKVATHYVIRDTLYFQVNKNHYNIDIDFMVKEPSNPEADEDGFIVYNWRKNWCQQDLDGRFPILTDKEGPLEGQLRYAMPTFGFKSIFTIKTLKLRVKIRDRALNESNTILTKEFTL
ncbi:MAG TPA: hypothetical protein VGD65_06320 [Chryseosolibacter sp.]